MPRPPRADEAGAIYHVLNRGNARQTIFHKDEDFAAFEQVISEGLERFAVNLFSYQWMSNHWHMVLSPQLDGEMSRFLYWITMTHTARYHAHYSTVGEGHVYQGRYKSFPIEDDAHFLTACRYVERNALAAMTANAEKQFKQSLERGSPFGNEACSGDGQKAWLGVNPTQSRTSAKICLKYQFGS